MTSKPGKMGGWKIFNTNLNFKKSSTYKIKEVRR